MKSMKKICLFLVPLSISLYILVSSSDSKSTVLLSSPKINYENIPEELLQKEEIFQDEAVLNIEDIPKTEPEKAEPIEDRGEIIKNSVPETKVLYLISKAVYLEETENLLYKWTDANGQLHITDYPPPEKSKTQHRYIKKVDNAIVYVIKDTTSRQAKKRLIQKFSNVAFSKRNTETTTNKPSIEDDSLIEDIQFDDYEEEPSDPFEPLNRKIFIINDRLYFLVIKPISEVYSSLVPEDFRIIVRNFFYNITSPARVINCLLQGKFKDAGNEALRFGINTTVGVLGLAPVAEDFGIKGKEEDFGQTLAVYGVGTGPYIVLPIVGPSNLRDLVGDVADAFLDPLNHFSKLETVVAIQSYRYVNKTSLHLGEYEDLKASALDPYIALKDAYIQHRNEEVKK